MNASIAGCLTLDKARHRLYIVQPASPAHKTSGTGRVLRVCAGACCADLPKGERARQLPCGHHGLVVECTCRIRDKQCRVCGRVYVEAGLDWYEIHDPHEEAIE